MDEREYRNMFEAEDRYFWFMAKHRLVKSLVEDAVAGKKDAVIVDVGCGTGGQMAALGNIGSVFGVEENATAISLAAKRGLRGLARMDWKYPALKSNCADVVICSDFLEHLDDDVRALQDIADVLKVGGKLIVTVPSGQWLWSEHDAMLGHKRRYNRRNLRRAVETSGIRPVRVFPFNGSLLPVMATARFGSKLASLAGLKSESPSVSYSLPGPVNKAFGRVLDIERELLKRGRELPFGSTLVALGIKDAKR